MADIKLDPELVQRLERAREYIEDCYDEGMDLDQVAQRAFLSR